MPLADNAPRAVNDASGDAAILSLHPTPSAAVITHSDGHEAQAYEAIRRTVQLASQVADDAMRTLKASTTLGSSALELRRSIDDLERIGSFNEDETAFLLRIGILSRKRNLERDGDDAHLGGPAKRHEDGDGGEAGEGVSDSVAGLSAKKAESTAGAGAGCPTLSCVITTHARGLPSCWERDKAE